MMASHWGLLMFRGCVAVLFGALALIWPGLTLVALVLLFGGYAFADGVLALVMAFSAKGAGGRGWLIIEAIAGIGAGLITFVFPGITAIALLALIAAWSLMSGIAAIVAAIALRQELKGEWPLPVAGALSVLFALILMLRPDAGALAVAWMIGIYAILYGVTLIVLSTRVRHLLHDAAPAM